VWVKGHCLSFLDSQRTSRADGKAKASAIAQFVAHDASLTVDDFDSPLGARGHTETTTVAQCLINAYDLSLHHSSSQPLAGVLFAHSEYLPRPN
jgi:hypothetical protein